MASINKLASGKWRVQVRCKGHYLTTSFSLRKDAEMWARRIEREIDLGQKPAPKHKDGIKTVSDLIDLHIADMTEVGKLIGRSKAFSLDLLRARLGRLNIADLSREQVIKFGKERAEEGAGPVTVGIDIGYVRTLLVHGAAVHGLPYSAEPVELGRVALTRLGLVGKGNERDRRPTLDEIEALIRHFRGNNFQIIPVDKIIRFAIATAMRLGEICNATWEDLNDRNNTLLIRDRKDPRHKKGNHMRIPLLPASCRFLIDSRLRALAGLVEEWPVQWGIHRGATDKPANTDAIGKRGPINRDRGLDAVLMMLRCSASAAARKRSISACDNCLEGFDLAMVANSV